MLTLSSLATTLDETASESERLAALSTLCGAVSVQLIEQARQYFFDSLYRQFGQIAALEDLGKVSIELAGTGGSGIAGRFNTSTAAAFVVAACGMPVVKLGNGAVTGKTGSSDFLAQAGISPLHNLERVAEIFDRVQLVFLFAPALYPELGRLQALRRRLGRPTIFNYIGPLLSPLRPAFRLMGVSSEAVLAPVAEVLSRDEATTCALMVRGEDGLDEISVDSISRIIEVSNSTSRQYHFDGRSGALASRAGSNVECFEQIIDGIDTDSKQYKIMVLNAGAALAAAQKAESINAGMALAGEAIKSGAVRQIYDKCKVVYGKFS